MSEMWNEGKMMNKNEKQLKIKAQKIKNLLIKSKEHDEVKRCEKNEIKIMISTNEKKDKWRWNIIRYETQKKIKTCKMKNL